MNEADLTRALDDRERLIRDCVANALPFSDFVARYDNFFHSWALDGHEATYEEKKLIEKYVRRIALHQRVAVEVLDSVCSDEDAGKSSYIAAGRFGASEAVLRLRKIVAEYATHG